jgi:hypothetical protein
MLPKPVRYSAGAYFAGFPLAAASRGLRWTIIWIDLFWWLALERSGIQKMFKNFSRTGFEPVTDGYQLKISNYSPPLYQLSYHENLAIAADIYLGPFWALITLSLWIGTGKKGHCLTFREAWHGPNTSLASIRSIDKIFNALNTGSVFYEL